MLLCTLKYDPCWSHVHTFVWIGVLEMPFYMICMICYMPSWSCLGYGSGVSLKMFRLQHASALVKIMLSVSSWIAVGDHYTNHPFFTLFWGWCARAATHKRSWISKRRALGRTGSRVVSKKRASQMHKEILQLMIDLFKRSKILQFLLDMKHFFAGMAHVHHCLSYTPLRKTWMSNFLEGVVTEEQTCMLEPRWVECERSMFQKNKLFAQDLTLLLFSHSWGRRNSHRLWNPHSHVDWQSSLTGAKTPPTCHNMQRVVPRASGWEQRCGQHCVSGQQISTWKRLYFISSKCDLKNLSSKAQISRH